MREINCQKRDLKLKVELTTLMGKIFSAEKVYPFGFSPL